MELRWKDTCQEAPTGCCAFNRVPQLRRGVGEAMGGARAGLPAATR